MNDLDDVSDVKDYAIQITVKNNRLLERMRAAGYENGKQLSDACGVHPNHVGEYLNLKKSAITTRGKWRGDLVRIATFLRCLPEDIMPPQHHRSPLKKNTVEIAMSSEEVTALMDVGHARLPDRDLLEVEASNLVIDALSTLNAREERILRLYYGFDGEPKTYKAIADILGICLERVRQIEAKARRKLRGPSKTDSLEGPTRRDKLETAKDIFLQ